MGDFQLLKKRGKRPLDWRKRVEQFGEYARATSQVRYYLRVLQTSMSLITTKILYNRLLSLVSGGRKNSAHWPDVVRNGLLKFIIGGTKMFTCSKHGEIVPHPTDQRCPMCAAENTVGTQPTDAQQTHYAILREIMEGLKSAMRKKDGSVYFQSSVSSESWEVMVGAKQHNA